MLDLVTHGGFVMDVVVATANALSWTTFVNLAGPQLQLTPIIAALGVAAVVFSVWRRPGWGALLVPYFL